MSLRDIDINRPLLKVTEESERTVIPSITYQTAMKALARKAFAPEFRVHDFDGTFWVADCDAGFRSRFPDFDYALRVGGKGPSRDQCLASGSMEFVERYSLHERNIFKDTEIDCLDLRDGAILKLDPMLEMRNTKCVAAGNNYEEAILHCLHELLETRLPGMSLWEPLRIIPLETLFPDIPEWVVRSILLVSSPVEAAGYNKFTAILYPFDGVFDEADYKLLRKGEKLIFSPGAMKPPKYHSPNSGGAAGLNPQKTAFRAMCEIFQFQQKIEGHVDSRRRPHPQCVPTADIADLPNRESESITQDIRTILEILGDDVFVGVVDFTDPELGLPVVKLISDCAPNRSLVSRENLGLFFEF